MRHSIKGDGEMRHRRLVFPSLLGLSWTDASEKVRPLAFNYMPAPTPDDVFAAIVRGAHADVLTLTAALLMFWTMNEKQASDIGGRTARALMRGEGAEEDAGAGQRQAIGFRSFALDIMRMEMAGTRYERSSYAAELNHLVEVLDNMTERRVVPGRTYTPSTLHGREDLLLPVLSILLALAPGAGDDGLVERLSALAREETILPEGDKSLREVSDELKRLRGTLEHPLPQLVKGAAMFAPQQDLNGANTRLHDIFGQAIAGIEAERLKRLDARSPDPGKLERIRTEIEVGLLDDPPKLAYFRHVAKGKTEDSTTEWRDMTFSGISKAQLVEPPMESTVSNFEEMFVSGTKEMAGNYAWRAFRDRPRRVEQIRSKIEDVAFWQEIDPFVKAVGIDPVLVVSQAAEGRALRRFLYASPEDRPALQFERRNIGALGNYLITIEGVDVFGSDLAPGSAWLFSAKALRSVRYGEVDPAGRRVTIAFEPGENRQGKMRVRVRQHLEWDASPIFELHTIDPPEDDQLEP